MFRFALGALLSVSTVVMVSCGVEPERRADGSLISAPKYLIARADIKDKQSHSSKVDFASVSSRKEISSAKDAERAFNAGERIVADGSGRMKIASSSDVEFGLGAPSQMPTQMSTSCKGSSCGPSSVPVQNPCECSYGNGVVTSNQGFVLFPRLRAFFQNLNPFAKVGEKTYPYNGGTQYSAGQYQYTVYKQTPPAQQPGYQLPYAPQGPGTAQPTPVPQGPTGQEPMPGSLVGL